MMKRFMLAVGLVIVSSGAIVAQSQPTVEQFVRVTRTLMSTAEGRAQVEQLKPAVQQVLKDDNELKDHVEQFCAQAGMQAELNNGTSTFDVVWMLAVCWVIGAIALECDQRAIRSLIVGGVLFGGVYGLLEIFRAIEENKKEAQARARQDALLV